MSKVAKWKMEKAKVKVVFRLQFHATHIPQNGWEKLFISFIPTDTGKATAKTNKANARNGTCKWADPIYETTRLLLDSKTKQYDDKLYKIVVGMGTSRSSILGEATINLADYADASQPSVVALPLHGSDHGTVLHVTVQLLTAKTGFREFEQQRDKGLQSGNNVNKETENSTVKLASSELQIPDDLVNKAKARIQLREETNIHGEYSDSQVTCDESSTTSENYSADKHDSPAEKLGGSDQAKLDDDVARVYEENNRLKASLAVAESSISELKQELTALQSHANEMGTETRKLTQELTTEIASGQELVKEVNFLKSECSKFKDDLQKITEMQSSSKVTEGKLEKTKNDTEVNLVNGVLLVEGQIREIQEKILTCESDSSSIQSEFEVLLFTLQELRNGNTSEIPILPLRELDVAKAEKEDLVKKMDEMECYYESLVHELEENQKRILGDFQNLKTEMNDLSSVNNELQKRVTVSESALKRARLNYSIAVSQLQKDLDMLSFQVLSMFETNQTVIKEAFADASEPSPNHLSNDLKKSLSLQENIYKKVEEELGEMCSANLHLNVYSGTLEETVFEASDYIRKTTEKLRETDKKLQISNRSRDVLHDENEYHHTKCNELQQQNRMLESDLGNLSNENFLLMEKITECEALLTDYRVYKRKYEDVSAEKLEFQKLLEAEASDKQNLLKEIEILKDKYLQDLVIFEESTREELVKLKECLDAERGMKITLEGTVAGLTSELESQRSEVCHVRKLASDQELEIGQLKDMLTESKAEIEHLKEIQRKLGDMESRLNACIENEAFYIEENGILKSEVESLRLELHASAAKHAEIEESKIEYALVASQLEETLTKSKDEVDLYIEENGNLKTEIESLRVELQAAVAKNAEILSSQTENVLVANQLKETLTKSKDEVARFAEENGNLKMEVESLRLELQASVAKNAEVLLAQTENVLVASQLKETLTKSKDEVARYIEENRNLATEIASLRSELQASVFKVDEISESKRELALEASQLKETLTKSTEDAACYIEENRNLASEIESLRLELQASVDKFDEISESETEHALEASQLKAMLTKSKEEVACYHDENGNLKAEIESLRLELQVSVAKNAETEESKTEQALEVSQLKDLLTKSKEDADRYTEENRHLASKIESLSLELQASVAKNAEISESKTEHALEAGQVKDMLTKSKEDVARFIEENRNLKTEIESLRSELQASVAKIAEISDSETVHALEVGQLKEMLTMAKDDVARFIEENRNLNTEIESLRLELQASVAKNAEISESQTVHALEAGQLKEMLTNSNEDVARLFEENGNLKTEIESLRLELQASVAKNAEISESETVHALEAGQLKEMLTMAKEDVTRFIDENRNLNTEIESLRLELQASVAKNAEISESETVHVLEAGQLKEMLTKSNEDVARFIEENRNLKTEIESLRLELQASVAKNAEISESQTLHALEASQLKEMLTKSKEDVARFLEENRNLATEVGSLKLKLETEPSDVTYKNAMEVDDVLVSREESDTVLLVFKSKLQEQDDELISLQNKCNQLTNKLSEQKLKTEEFKNLSIYLKELKDNADAAHEQKERDTEGPAESLRIAFIKEQYQTKLQELKQQLSVSKRHNEEMLFKLQDALDEIENRKKSEASQLRRIQELEAEGESVISDKSDYDRLRAELECAVLSLECCKEEKEKLAALLQECGDEKSRIADELSLIREKLAQKEENGSVNVREIQGGSDSAYEDEENPSADDSKQLTVVNNQFRTQDLISCMEQLDVELEKMKNENSLVLPLTNGDPSFEDLQRELAQLHQANEELGSIYPNFVDFRGNGNALERVLALEIELAEALRAKKKSSIQFQSSFLKQHSDEEAVFKSFRDINELIKDMLEIKGKYVSVENELKEMHDRYSDLSLKFAEVEGERQKLKMTVKNMKNSRNLLRNRASMAATLGDQSL